MSNVAEIIAENARLKAELGRLQAELDKIKGIPPDNEPWGPYANEGTKLLQDFGVCVEQAHQLGNSNPVETIKAWIAYANAQSTLTNPAGFVVAKLQKREDPPKTKTQPQTQKERARQIRDSWTQQRRQ